MAKRLTVPEPDDQLLEAFRVFDKEGMGTRTVCSYYKIMQFGSGNRSKPESLLRLYTFLYK